MYIFMVFTLHIPAIINACICINTCMYVCIYVRTSARACMYGCIIILGFKFQENKLSAHYTSSKNKNKKA